MPAGLLGIEELDRAEIEAILARAKDFQPLQSQSLKKLDTLRGKMIVNLFYEASTRTRTSFEIAAKRLGADAVSITASGSSVSKGESLVDTLNTLAAMRPDAIVMRHSASGAPHFLARYLATPIINAGDGTHEHPTQALLDARTILDRRGSLEGLRVAIIGDIAHSRVARSNVHLLAKFGVEIVLCGPASLLPRELADLAPGVRLTTDIREAIRDSRRDHDAARATGAATRSVVSGQRVFPAFMVCNWSTWTWPARTPSSCTPARSTAAASFPPRSPIFTRSVILNQVENGIAVRMAVLERVIG